MKDLLNKRFCFAWIRVSEQGVLLEDKVLHLMASHEKLKENSNGKEERLFVADVC